MSGLCLMVTGMTEPESKLIYYVKDFNTYSIIINEQDYIKFGFT
jgi:hypothetical protein